MSAAEPLFVELPRPDDWHVHLRDDDMLDAVADFSARWFRYALVMPNLSPPITTTAQAVAYRDRIIAATSIGTSHFEPRMTLYLTPSVSATDLLAGWRDKVIAGVKFYPAGATTNSGHGAGSLATFHSVLGVMAEHGIPLLVHAESTDPSIDIFDREAAFLDADVVPLLNAFPELRVTVEHISTADGVALVEEFEQTAGSITPHHLSCDRSDLLANGLRPELYCKPVINSAADRAALVAAATSGSDRFFLGSDSAPHPLSTKEARVAAAGIFNAPYALHVSAEVFYQAGALENLADFVSRNGAYWYGKTPSKDEIRMTRVEQSTVAPRETVTTAKGDEVRLFGVDEARLWSIKAI